MYSTCSKLPLYGLVPLKVQGNIFEILPEFYIKEPFCKMVNKL